MGQVHIFLAVRVMAWLSEAYQSGAYDLSIYPAIGVQPVDNARNEIVQEFLKSDCTHLLFVDSDTVPPQETITKLLAADKDIISGLTPIIEYDDTWKHSDSNGFYKKWNVVNEKDQHASPHQGVIPIKGAGSSCILIKRAVFEKLKAPWYRFVYNDDSGKPVVVGEDIYFVIKAIGAGFKPFADTDVICSHHKSILW